MRGFLSVVLWLESIIQLDANDVYFLLCKKMKERVRMNGRPNRLTMIPWAIKVRCPARCSGWNYRGVVLDKMMGRLGDGEVGDSGRKGG